MHEGGIARQILEVALARAAAAGAPRISEVQLEIGEDSDVAPESLEHYWPEVAAGTPAEGARLVFTSVPEVRTCRLVAIEVP
jgi:Zn finger protein HypA/HybF involved in hydrogenase expression